MTYGIVVQDLVRGLVVSMAALAVLGCLRRTTASTRHFLAALALLSLLALPWVRVSSTPPRNGQEPVRPTKALVDTVSTVRMATASEPIAVQGEALQAARSFETAVVTIWAFGVALLLLRLLAGFRRVAEWKKTCVTLPGAGDNVWVGERIPVPMTAWVGRPIILLPQEADSWDKDRLNSVLTHEMAHIRRGDWLWQIAGQAACAFYWPLPTVWMLQKLARADAERACDDLVVKSGVAPTEYAQELVSLASDLRRGWPVPALPMASKTELRWRVEHVLNSNRRKGSVAVGALVGGGGMLAALGCPAFVGPLLDSQDSPTPYGYAQPGSRSGTPENGFVGITSNGRRVELLQLSRWNGSALEAWRPDGKRLNPGEVFTTEMRAKKPHEIQLVFRAETSVADDSVVMWLGSGPFETDGPTEMAYGRGPKVLPADGFGKRMALTFVEVPQPNGGATAFTFGLEDGPWRTMATVNVSPDGKVQSSSPELKEVKLTSPVSVSSFRFAANGKVVLDSKGEPVVDHSIGTRLQFLVKDSRYEDMRVSAVTRDGQRIESCWNTGSGDSQGMLHENPEFQLLSKDIDRIEVRVRTSQNVEFRRVRIVPDPRPSP